MRNRKKRYAEETKEEAIKIEDAKKTCLKQEGDDEAKQVRRDGAAPW